jgi:hypothetical protein
MAVQAALMKFLRAEPSALSELAQLLGKASITSATLFAIVTESWEQYRSSRRLVSINQGKTS